MLARAPPPVCGTPRPTSSGRKGAAATRDVTARLQKKTCGYALRLVPHTTSCNLLVFGAAQSALRTVSSTEKAAVFGTNAEMYCC